MNNLLQTTTRVMDDGGPSGNTNAFNTPLTPPSSGGDSRLGNFLELQNRAPDVRGCINYGISQESSVQSGQLRTSVDGILGKISPPGSKSSVGEDDSSVEFFPPETGRSDSFVQFSPARNQDAKRLANFMAQEELSNDSCAPSRDTSQPSKTWNPFGKKKPSSVSSVKSMEQFIAEGMQLSTSSSTSGSVASSSSTPVEYESSSSVSEPSSNDSESSSSAGSGYFSLQDTRTYNSLGAQLGGSRHVHQTDTSSVRPPAKPLRRVSDPNYNSRHHPEVSEVAGSSSPESYSGFSLPGKSSSSSTAAGRTKPHTSRSSQHPEVSEVDPKSSPESYSDLSMPVQSNSSSSGANEPLLTPSRSKRTTRLADRKSVSPAQSRLSMGSTTSHTLLGQLFVPSPQNGDDASMAYSETSAAFDPSFHDSDTMPSLTSMSRSTRSWSRSSYNQDSVETFRSPTTVSTPVSASSAMPSLASFSPSSIGFSTSSSSANVPSTSSSVSVSSTSSSATGKSKGSRSSTVSAKSRSSSASARSKSSARSTKSKSKYGKSDEPYDGALLMMVDKMHGSGSSLGFNDSVKSLKSEYSKSSCASDPGVQRRMITSIIDDTPRAAREPGRSLHYVSSASTSGAWSDDETEYMLLKCDQKRASGSMVKAITKPRRKDSSGSSSSQEPVEEERKSSKKKDWNSLLAAHLQSKRGSKDADDSHESSTPHGSVTVHSTLHSRVSLKSAEETKLDSWLDSSARSTGTGVSVKSVEETKELMDRLDGSIRTSSLVCKSASPIRPKLRFSKSAKRRLSAPPRLDRIRSPRRRHQLLCKHQKQTQQQQRQQEQPVKSPTPERVSLSKLVEELSISNLDDLSVSDSKTTTSTLPPLPPPSSSPSPTSSTSRRSRSILSLGLPPVDPKARTVRMSNRSIFSEKPKKRRSSRPRPLTNTPLTRSPVLPKGTIVAIPDLPFGSESSSCSESSSSSSRQSFSRHKSVSSHMSVNSGATLPPAHPRYSTRDSDSSRSGRSSMSSGSSTGSSRRSLSRHDRGKMQLLNTRARSLSPKQVTKRPSRAESYTSAASSTTDYSLAPIRLDVPKTPPSSDKTQPPFATISESSSVHATIGCLSLDDDDDDSVDRDARHERTLRDDNEENRPVSMPILELSPARKGPNSIWARLEQEKKRQQRLRARLFESRELQTSPRGPRAAVKAF